MRSPRERVDEARSHAAGRERQTQEVRLKEKRRCSARKKKKLGKDQGMQAFEALEDLGRPSSPGSRTGRSYRDQQRERREIRSDRLGALGKRKAYDQVGGRTSGPLGSRRLLPLSRASTNVNCKEEGP